MLPKNKMTQTQLPDHYFTQHYALTPPHSEVIAALPLLTPGHALDIGCGQGRNTLWLNQQGFDVTAWDKNPQSIEKINHIVATESLKNINTACHDLNQHRFNGAYQFVFSTVTMMFLRPDTIPQLIADMQASTVFNGYNLIISAMSTDDFPCPMPFSFTFGSGELSHYYRDWYIVKYNEDVGELHKRDENGQRIKLRFATLLARKAPPNE